MNFLLFKATAVFFVLQLPLLYGTWALFPIFGKERRRLGWTLSFYCAVFMIVPALLEFGHVRLTIYERLRLDAISLGLASPENATVFSEWAPGFLSRVQQLPAFPFSATEVPSIPPSMVDNLRTGVMDMEGGENYPHESIFGILAAAYFVGYVAGDLILGWIHYRDQIDPLSEWAYHIVYGILSWRHAIAKQISIFAICGGPLEMSTIFLALGNMNPALKSGFCFLLTFILSRIAFHALLLHEVYFSYPAPCHAAGIYAGALGLHIYWIRKYFVEVRRRARRAKKVATEAELEKRGDAAGKTTNSTVVIGISTGSSSLAGGKKAIQLRMRIQEPNN
ncbi:hypothetical protein BGX23_006009 [Mortierella sp. AD031]|nr:hypothetical protein BGX23_006009 [Mortierella sp. AD031]